MSEADCMCCAPPQTAASATSRARRTHGAACRLAFVWGEEDGEVCFTGRGRRHCHPHTSVVRFAETGSARRVWLWFRSEGLKFRLQLHQGGAIRWVEASYTAIPPCAQPTPLLPAPTPMAKPARNVLDAAGMAQKSACDVCRAPSGKCSSQSTSGLHRLAEIRSQPGTYRQEHAARTAQGARRRERGQRPSCKGCRCGHCGRACIPTIAAATPRPAITPGQSPGRGRGVYCLNIGGGPDRRNRHRAFLAALEPAGLAATLARPSGSKAIARWSEAMAARAEQASYDAQRAERRYRASTPTTGLVAPRPRARMGGRLRALAAAKADLERAKRQQPRMISQQERDRLLALGPISLPSGRGRQRPRARQKGAAAHPNPKRSSLGSSATRPRRTSHCAGRAARSTKSIWLCRARGQRPSAPMRTRSRWWPGSRFINSDSVIAGILNRQGRTTAYGHRFTAGRVGNLASPLGYPVL